MFKVQSEAGAGTGAAPQLPGAVGERKGMKVRWCARFLGVFAAATVLTHTAVVGLLYRFHLSPIRAESWLEPVLVVAWSFPLMYLLAIRPLVREMLGRQRAERALVESQELLQTVIRASSIGVLAYRESGQCILANPAAALVAGASQGELLRQNFRRLDSWKKSGLLEATQTALDSGQPAQAELQLTSTFGKVMWAEFRLVPFTLDGEANVLVLIDEVSERKRRAEELRESEERYRRLVELSPDGILLASDGRIVFANSAALKLLGASRLEEIKGKPELELVHPACREQVQQRMSTVQEQDKAQPPTEEKYLRLDGGLVEVEVAGAAFPMEGRPGRITLMRDISQKKALEKQLLHAQRMESIGTLAAGIAHDLNNILAPISMSAELLQMTARDEQEDQTLSTILSSARRGADVVRQVLTFARGIDGERVRLQPRHLLKEIEKIVCETFPKSITFRRQAPNDLWPVLGDATQLHQVLLNLCVNARDAMPEGGTMVVSAANVQLSGPHPSLLGKTGIGPHVLLTVSDTGHGIAAGLSEKIFEPFFTTKELGKGTGLGLSTVLGIVRSHGGSIEVESRPGCGATFKVYLPAEPGEKVAPARSKGRAAPAGSGETILVVDDEANIRAVAERALTLNGYQVLLAKDGQEALEVVGRRAEVKAVVTDILMPRTDGVALIQGLKRSHPRLPVIACTGWGQEGLAGQLKELGVTSVLTKPYPSEALITALHSELAAR